MGERSALYLERYSNGGLDLALALVLQDCFSSHSLVAFSTVSEITAFHSSDHSHLVQAENVH